ncbi:hypothetical protein [Streptomyces daghestanicus]|uniref:Uncharacterized protein n=1 Tax=Streptomyces daghestanicus TaxID=66885 RepID=A0ABQ3Q7U7_9ACTN|nr:hypothetical protein [Streptomyces daghestanicus]GGU68526.1 hypothetical protein GCM10010259_68120 [Streptomyces daghestanicus]GHI33358.1 hypothetical protein Sdagh_50880 [Streptomyces daghestanicus]
MVTDPPPAASPVSGTQVSDTLAWLSSKLTPIRVLDAGARGLPASWDALDGLVRSTVCDPLADAAADRGDTVVDPVAVSVHGGSEELKVTRDPDRSSLLEPHRAVVARYGDAAGFEVCERRPVPAATLRQLRERHDSFDVLQLTTQGLEYALLSSDLDAVRDAVCIDVAGGLVDDYVGQYPLAVVAPLLRGLGYSLLDLSTATRPAAGWGDTVRHQPLEYRGLWMKDDLVCGTESTRLEQAVKLLVLCKTLGHHAFGHELATALRQRALLPPGPARVLARAGFWALPWSL